MNDLLRHAYQFARERHVGQQDKCGEPYIKHLEQVATLLIAVNAAPEVVAAGYLHDVLEDTDTTYDELVIEFGLEIADLVNEVTQEGDRTTGYYFPRLKSEKAILLKFADKLSNLSRLGCFGEEEKAHQLKKSVFWKTQV